MTTIADRIAPSVFTHAAEPPARRLSWAAVGASVEHVVTMLLDWQERARQRRLLLSLDTAALKDFGKSCADAAGEGAKPFWRK